MKPTCSKRFTFHFLVLFVMCLLSELTQAQTEELISTMPESSFRTYGELYSENNLYNKEILITDSRLRQYFSLLELRSDVRFDIEAFVGASWQAQFLDDSTKYPTDAVSPSIGVRANWNQWVYLTLEERYRMEYDTENAKSESDPRFVISGGQFFPWSVVNAQYLFTEFYGEASWVYRVDPAPVGTFWLKQGYRVPVISKLFFDPYLEFYSRQSPNIDLGTNLNEGRAGGRLLYVWDKFSFAAHLYQPFASANRDQLAGLLVIGGIF